MPRPGFVAAAPLLLLLALLLPATAAAHGPPDDADEVPTGGVQPTPFAAPSYGGAESCSCHLDLTHLAHSNLGGLGPDFAGLPQLRYSNVCGQGVSADLVLEVVGGGYQGAPALNGRSSCGPYGSVSVKFGSMVGLRARFVKPGTNDAVTMERVFFSVLDLDLSGSHREKVTLKGFDDFFVSPRTRLEHERVLNGAVFTSRLAGESVSCVRDPLSMTPQQADYAVTALYQDVSEFEFTLEVLGEETSDSHNFLIGGTSSLRRSCAGAGADDQAVAEGGRRPEPNDEDDDCGRHVDCDMSLTKLIHNNLGGLGPDVTEPKTVRFGGICESSKGPVDLVISAASDYHVADPHRNGQAEGPYGRVSLALGTYVRLQVTLVHADTNTPIRLPSFLFSFFGLCDADSYAPTVTFHGHKSYWLSDDTAVQAVQTGLHLVVKAAGPCTADGPPADPLMCSRGQEREIAQVLFRDASGFNITLAAAGPEAAQGGRDFLFGGRSCLTGHGCGRKEAASPLASTTPRPAFDCAAGLEHWETQWDMEKKTWCCEKERKGCSEGALDCGGMCNHNGTMGSCKEGIQSVASRRYAHAEDACVMAVAQVRLKCGGGPAGDCSSCTVENSGCAAAPALEPAGGVGDTFQPPPFLCEVNLEEWDTRWSDAKKEYCCRHEKLGCPRLIRKFTGSALSLDAPGAAALTPHVLAAGGLCVLAALGARLAVGRICSRRRNVDADELEDLLQPCGGDVARQLDDARRPGSGRFQALAAAEGEEAPDL